MILCARAHTCPTSTQMDTIRKTDGPLVPMVPIEKGVISMVLLVNMHLIKGTLIIFPCDLAGYRAIPMVHWYQWYDWYQWKMMPFQWFYWCKTSSLLHQVGNALIIIVNIPRSISQPRNDKFAFTPSKSAL